MDLIRLLPSYYEHNETMKELQEILSQKTDKLEKQMEDAVNQCSVEKGDKGLARWEEMMGIATDITKSNQYRRERLKAKISGAGTTTKSLVENIASSYTNAEVEIIEQFEDYTITVRFVGTVGIPGNIEDVKYSIEEAVPAHLAVIYEYIYNTHGQNSRFTHSQLKAYTHKQIWGEPLPPLP